MRSGEYLTECSSKIPFFPPDDFSDSVFGSVSAIEDAKDKGSLEQKDLFQRNVTKPRVRCNAIYLKTSRPSSA